MTLDSLRLLAFGVLALSALVAAGSARWPRLRWAGLPCALGWLAVLVAGWLKQ